MDDTNDKDLLFPPRPTPKPKPYPLEFQQKGLHENSVDLKHASDINVIAVAEVVKSISDNMKGKTPLDTVPNLARVVNTLLDLSKPLAQLLIENRLHEVFRPDGDSNLKLPNLDYEASKEQPHCYGMFRTGPRALLCRQLTLKRDGALYQAWSASNQGGIPTPHSHRQGLYQQ
jgi:hypothetical protein